MNKKKDTTTEPEFIKVWKTSITKAELAELPAETFSGQIIVVDDEEKAESAVRELSKSKIVGFDTETKPSFRKGQRHDVALLQLSDTEKCFLFRLNKIGLPQRVKELLENQEITKIGVSIHDDFLSLKKKFEVEPVNFIDLQTFVKSYGIADNSLSRIYAILFDKRISKGQRLSNWEASELTKHQKEYAALDAIACVTIYEHLTKVGFDHTQSKHYREFDEPAH